MSNEGNPSGIWRTEDELKETEIGRIPKEWGCIHGSGGSRPRFRTRITRMRRTIADFSSAEVIPAESLEWEVDWG